MLIARILSGNAVQRLITLEVLAQYLTAALFAYLSRVLWPIPVTPQSLSAAVHSVRSRISNLAHPAPVAPSALQ